jgi:hypothetical protein
MSERDKESAFSPCYPSLITAQPWTRLDPWAVSFEINFRSIDLDPGMGAFHGHNPYRS